ncbi:MAG: AarF/UbiB family protein [Myxococcota bacterium]
MAVLGAVTDLGRLQEIARVVIRHGFGHLMTTSALRRAAASDDGPDPSQAGRTAAERFASMLEDLGPTFVKLGQILSTRTDLLPPDFIEALSRLQDHVPPLGFDVVKQVVEGSLGKRIVDVFKELDPTCLASASIAQVHGATLLTGEEVVVKVQRPNIAARMQADISLMGTLAGVFDAVFEEAGVYRSKLVVKEFETALKTELDFTQELRNIQAFQQVHGPKKRIRIPTVYPELSSRTVLVMERMRGTRLSELPPDVDRATVAERFIAAAFDQVFVDGLFHGDPHPGNVLIMANGDIALLDFGLVGRLSRDAQDRLVALLLAVALRDPDSVARLLYRLGDSDERVTLSSFRSAVAELLDRYMGLALSEIKTQALMRDLMDLVVKHRIRIPREYAVLGKAAITFEGVIRDLHPQLDVAALAMPYATQLLRERYDVRKLEGGAPRLFLQLLGFVQDLPLQLSQILLDLEAGKLTVRVEGPGISELTRAVRMLGLLVVAGGIAAALVTSGVEGLSSLDLRVLGIPLVPALSLLGAFILFSAVVLYVLLDGKIPKASLRTLMRLFKGKNDRP